MKKLVSIIIVIALIAVGVGFVLHGENEVLGSGVGSDLLTTSSQTLVAVSSVSKSVLAANSGRKYASCYNREGGAGDAVWVTFGSTASVGGGFYVKASQSFSITDQNLYVGPITAVNRTGKEVGGSTASSSVRLVCVELSL